MKNRLSAFEWRQLAAITFAHATADLYMGILAPILVPMRDRFSLSLGALIFIVSAMGFASNIGQIAIGNLRASWTSPAVIIAGLFAGGAAVFVPNLPVLAATPLLALMSVLAVIGGLGVAAVHPEGLRAVQGLLHIRSAVSTPFFMVFGFFGFAGGAIISTLLTEHFGLRSLLFLYLLAPLATAGLLLCRVRLPRERGAAGNDGRGAAEGMPSFPFWPLFAAASFLATSSQVLSTVLPSYLHSVLGYTLSFGGLSFTLFGLGGMAGSLIWGALCPRLGIFRILLGITTAGVPLNLLYLWLAPRTGLAAAELLLTGFIVYAGFPFCVTLARYSKTSLRQSQRMGWASGGSWGIAAVVMWALSPFVDRIGLGPILHIVWGGYLAAALTLLWMWRRQKNAS